MPNLDWQKSSFSAEAANCLDLASAGDDTVQLRESDEPGVVLAVSRGALREFIRGVKAGEWDGLG